MVFLFVFNFSIVTRTLFILFAAMTSYLYSVIVLLLPQTIHMSIYEVFFIAGIRVLIASYPVIPKFG